MRKDAEMERLSDLVRMGVPITFADAIRVIDYQEKLRKERRSWLYKAKDFFRYMWQ